MSAATAVKAQTVTGKQSKAGTKAAQAPKAGLALVDLTALNLPQTGSKASDKVSSELSAMSAKFNEQQKLLAELGSGGLSTLRSYVDKFGHDVPESVIEPVRLFWFNLYLFKKGITDLANISKKDNQGAQAAARQKLMHIRYAVKGYKEGVVSVTEAANLGKPGGNTRAKQTPRQQLQSIAKRMSKLEVKDRTPAEKTFFEALAVYVASIG